MTLLSTLFEERAADKCGNTRCAEYAPCSCRSWAYARCKERTEEPNMAQLRVTDNDRDEIIVTLDGNELRGWSYSSEQERRVKMLCAREFVEGFCAAEVLHNMERKT